MTDVLNNCTIRSAMVVLQYLIVVPPNMCDIRLLMSLLMFDAFFCIKCRNTDCAISIVLESNVNLMLV